MDFHIKKFLSHKTTETEEQRTLRKITKILNLYTEVVTQDSFRFSRGILYLENIHPLIRIHIKKNKTSIIKKLKQEMITIRDII